MPGSALTVRTQSSDTSSKRTKSRRYYSLRNGGDVDETLFGKTNRERDRENLENLRNATPTEVAAERRSAGRTKSSPVKKTNNTVKVITKDLIRNLKVPSEDPCGQSIIIDRQQLSRIQGAARVLTEQEELLLDEHRKMEKESVMDAAEGRKAEMRKADVKRKTNRALNELELEAQAKAESLLERANDKRLEQEDEVKYLNELILEAKCHAIRDAQLLEKAQIATELQVEERRLDHAMEMKRREAIGIQEAIERRRKEEQYSGASKLCEQIAENEQDKLFELEKKDQENVQIKKYLEKLMDEDRLKIEKRRAQQMQLREQLNVANDEILKRKEVAAEQEKALDLRVLDFQRQKAEREAAFEADQEKSRIEKEMEVARLRSMQERAHDEQAERDGLRAKREQERVEREWRRKEADETRKKSEMEEALESARKLQLQQKEHFVAVQAQRERADFERVLRAQKELLEKEELENHAVKQRRVVHSTDIRKQIHEKESERIRDRQKFFSEADVLDEEAKQRRLRLDEIKERKLNELRAAGIHDKYLNEVERRVRGGLLKH